MDGYCKAGRIFLKTEWLSDDWPIKPIVTRFYTQTGEKENVEPVLTKSFHLCKIKTRNLLFISSGPYVALGGNSESNVYNRRIFDISISRKVLIPTDKQNISSLYNKC